MAFTYVNKMVDEFDANPIYTPAQATQLEHLKLQLNQFSEKGKIDVFKLMCLYGLLNDQGLPIDTIQNQIELIMYLAYKNNFNFSDLVINDIISKVKNAEQYQIPFDRNLIHTIKF